MERQLFQDRYVNSAPLGLPVYQLLKLGGNTDRISVLLCFYINLTQIQVLSWNLLRKVVYKLRSKRWFPNQNHTKSRVHVSAQIFHPSLWKRQGCSVGQYSLFCHTSSHYACLLKLISTDGFQTSGLSSKRLIFQSGVLPVKEPLLHHLQIVPLASEKTKLLLL